EYEQLHEAVFGTGVGVGQNGVDPDTLRNFIATLTHQVISPYVGEHLRIVYAPDYANHLALVDYFSVGFDGTTWEDTASVTIGLNPTFNYALDGVLRVATPEPSTLTFFLLAIACGAVWRWDHIVRSDLSTVRGNAIG